MANTVKIKRSAVSGKVPLTTDLELGELALNTFDGKLYTKKDNGTVSIIQVGAGDFVGPASSTDNAIVRFDGTTGKLVQNSGVIIDDSGNVGIGTSSPKSLLHVEGTTTGTGLEPDSIAYFKQNATWSGSEPWALYVEGYSYLNGFRINAADGVRSLYKTASGGILGFATSTNTPITFTQNDSVERMRIDIGGNVGIGTTSPGAKLDVASATGTASPTPTTLNISTTSSGSDWSSANPWGRLAFYSADGSGGGGKPHVTLDAIASNTIGASSSFTISTTSESTNTLTERMRIDSSGNVGIGTASPAYKLDVTGSGRFGNGSGVPIVFINGGSAADNGGYINFQKGGANSFYVGHVSGVVGGSSNDSVIYNGAGNGLQIYTNNAERMRITSAGNVGIGTNAPTNKLTVAGAAGVDGIDLQVDTSNAVNSARMFWTNGTSGQGNAIYNSAGNLNLATGATPNSSSGAARLTIYSSGYNQSHVQFRAPIFYDSDNTAFYANLADSGLSINAAGYIEAANVSTNTQPTLGVTRMAGYGIIGNRSTWYLTNGGGDIQIGNGATHNASPSMTISATGITSLRNFAAPTFYDSDNSAYYMDPTSTSTSLNVAGNIIAAGDITANGGQVFTNAVDGRVKLSVWNSTTYGIGMDSGYTYGGIVNEYVMSFQMSNTSTRGFWWGDQGHTKAEGAMALTTDGKLTVAHSVRVGFGESDTTVPGSTYALEVNGAFAATTKSFVIDHPTKPDMKLRYGSLEGPENGVYVRGRLRAGENVILLPDYWEGLVDQDTYTVNLTPVGKHQELFVKYIADDYIVVGGEDIDCFYTVFAERKDVEKLEVEF